MLVILTHEKADFDAVASQLGASKLFAGSVALLPWSVNRNVQQFLNLYWDTLSFTRIEDWRRQKVDEVLLVDTQTLASLRGLSKSVNVQVIDHHPFQSDQPGWRFQIEPVGANTTLLVERLLVAGIQLSVEEATLMLLGVYEDTGSLSYDTTTARDVRAAAWLLEQGAQLSVVRRFLNVALSENQQQLYDMLLRRAERLQLEDRVILIATAAPQEGFADEISSVAHRLREALSPDALFVVVDVGDGVQVVARSSTDAIDVGEVARILGGGGHSRAAAAMIPGVNLDSVCAKLQSVLLEAVEPGVRVKSVMSHGLVTIGANAPVVEAAALMIREGHEGYPVVDEVDGRIVGLLTRRSVDRAVSHEMGQLPVSRVMLAGTVSVAPEDSIESVQHLMIAEGWGQIPVVEADGPEKGKLLGIVTRTDVLNALSMPSSAAPEPEMRTLMEESFPPAMWALALVISRTAGDMRMPTYLVGGQVRDLLLAKSPTDLDIVVEGDAIGLVENLRRRFGGEVHSHDRFGTAKWSVDDSIWQAMLNEAEGESAQTPEIRIANSVEPLALLPDTIDFVTARKEFYKRPTVLPDVERGSIKLDLHRRDFTVNTLAIRLDGAHLGQLLDFYGGRRDLQRGLIRVLHSLSFIDDPTRILRAIRLEQRLNFTIEPGTAELIAAALPLIARVTGERIRNEIELALLEGDPVRVLQRLDGLGVLEHIVPGLMFPAEAEALIARTPALVGAAPWREIYESGPAVFYTFALWLSPLSREIQQMTADRLRVRKATADDLLGLGELQDKLAVLPPGAPVSRIVAALRPFELRVLLAARILEISPHANAWLEKYISEWQHVRTAVAGDDLRGLGLKPGPIFTQILDQLLAARLDGQVTSREEEMEVVAALLADDSNILDESHSAR